jgi:hypothetical protein
LAPGIIFPIDFFASKQVGNFKIVHSENFESLLDALLLLFFSLEEEFLLGFFPCLFSNS